MRTRGAMEWIKRKAVSIFKGIREFEEDPVAFHKKNDSLPEHRMTNVDPEEEYDEEVQTFEFKDPCTGVMLQYEWEDLPQEVQEKISEQKAKIMVNSNGDMFFPDTISGILAYESESDSDADGAEFSDVDADYDEYTDGNTHMDDYEMDDDVDLPKRLREEPAFRIQYLNSLLQEEQTQIGLFHFADLIATLMYVEEVCFMYHKSRIVNLMRADIKDYELEDMRRKELDVKSYLCAFDADEVIFYTRSLYMEMKNTITECEFTDIPSEFDEFMGQFDPVPGVANPADEPLQNGYTALEKEQDSKKEQVESYEPPNTLQSPLKVAQEPAPVPVKEALDQKSATSVLF